MAGKEEERTRLHNKHHLINNNSPSSHPVKVPQSAKRSSKFNRILNNLERSILNQFGSQHNVNNSSKATKTPKKLNSPSSATTQTSTSGSGTKDLTTAGGLQNSMPNKRCNNVQQVQKHSHPTTAASEEGVTFQAREANSQPQKQNKSKMILNKYQQQIVSTMRSNQLLVNNKLSIPPPHANDEARNQNHPLLFGDGTTTQCNDQSQDASSRLSLSSRTSANKKVVEMGNKIREVAQLRSNSSPASSAVSLPAIPTKPGSQNRNASSGNGLRAQNNSSIDVDEESGFFTYQSRRSLMTKATAGDQDSANPKSNTGESQIKIKKPLNSSMILVPTTQVPLGSVSYNNMVAPQHQFLYNYHTQPMQQSSQNQHQTHLQQSMNAQQQQQLVASNQVPIPPLNSLSHLYTNSNQQQTNLMASKHHLQGPNQYNDHHRMYASYGDPATNVTVSPTMLPYMGASFDQAQQIYANAPPKPRRYQYYDPNQSMFPSNMMAPQNANMSSLANNPTILIKQPFNNHRLVAQQQQFNQPIYNTSYIQIPSMYQHHQQQQQGQLNQANSQSASNQLQQQQNNQQLQINNAYIQQQLGVPSILTKSKSSLEAADLTRFKQEDRRAVDGGGGGMNTMRSSHNLPPQQQLIYGSRLDGSIGYQNAHIPGGSSNFSQNNHLQRSKSVSHLLADYNGYPAINQHNLMISDHRQASAAPKFFSVSSASTNNINFVGLMPMAGQQMPQQSNQFAKVSSQLDIAQPSSHNHHNDPILWHNTVNNTANSSAKVYPATMLRPQRHQQRADHWHSGQQASPNNESYHNSQNDRQQSRLNQPVETNSVFSNKKSIGQSGQHNSDNFAPESSADGFIVKPSLDDKIRHLLIGGDSGLTDGPTRVGNNNHSNNATYHHHHSSTSDLSSQAAWAASIKQQTALSLPPTDKQLAYGKSSYRNCNDAISSENKISPSRRLQPSFLDRTTIKSYPNVTSDTATSADQLNNGQIYMNDPIVHSKTMGNRQQRQYQVTNNNARQQLESPLGANRSSPRNKNDSTANHSSKLIVDLTTPRVLAKTQTTLLSTPTNSAQLQLQPDSQTRDFQAHNWPASSINQVGLPIQEAISAAPSRLHNQSEQIAPINPQSVQNDSSEASTCSQNLSNNHSSPASSGEADNKKSVQSFERTAPYYYSDLKSEEQRQALLSIVQQKSLSPPPKLLSRSTDQSSTRLALKSATLHPGPARAISESLHQRQISLRSSAKSDQLLQQQQVAKRSMGDFSSVCNITKNIDKLFDSPTQAGSRDDEKSKVQSMLMLNDDCIKSDSLTQNSILTNLESLSSGYCSGDLQRNKNLASKSKSLENICQKSRAVCVANQGDDELIAETRKLRVPVYENIHRADKLMSAINNSTTCLSTTSSASRANKHHPKSASNAKYQLDDSVDSIFGSESPEDDDVLDDHDESESSLDIIDEIKISPSSDDQLSDISQLIEQLKSNHSKLSGEYRSTLFRISKIINSKDCQLDGSGHVKNAKLAKRLQSLEHKSRRCETRSKNQLALIRMMEKVLKQSKLRASNTITANSASLASAVQLSPGDKSKSLGNESKASSEGSQMQRQSASKRPEAVTEKNNVGPAQSPLVIKAIVTESKQEVVKSELFDASKASIGAQDPVNISGRIHHDQPQHQRTYSFAPSSTDDKMADIESSPPSNPNTNKKCFSSGEVSKKFSSSENQTTFTEKARQNNNPSDDNDRRRYDDTGSSSDDSSSIFSDENETVSLEQLSANNQAPVSPCHRNKVESTDRKENLGGLKGFMRDEEDFIEFLSTDGSSHRSQFEASQFSASDFNTSNSDTSQSGGCRDSPASADFASDGKGVKTSAGILKRSGPKGVDLTSCKLLDSIESNNNSINNGIRPKDKSNPTTTAQMGAKKTTAGSSRKFNNVLGNVIDVDVCPMNNMSQYSPINNQASC